MCSFIAVKRSSVASLAAARSGLADLWSNQSRTPPIAAQNVNTAAESASHRTTVSHETSDASMLSSVGGISDDDDYYDNFLLVLAVALLSATGGIAFAVLMLVSSAAFRRELSEQRRATPGAPTLRP
jgi:hypothetical protein